MYHSSRSKNILINGNPGDLLQRQDPATLTARSNDDYGADRWYILTQTASVQSQRVSSGGHQLNAWQLKQNQASAQRFGIAQIVESINGSYLRGHYVTFSGRTRIGTSQPIRYAILEWTGTADNVTSDVVNDWTSNDYTAGNFFLGSNLTVSGIGAITPSANTWSDFKVTAQINTSCNNIIVFVWTEGTAAQNVTVDFEELQLEEGESATTFSNQIISDTIAACQRYYEKSYLLDVAPGTATLFGFVSLQLPSSGTGRTVAPVSFNVSKRMPPTVTLYDSMGSSGVIDYFVGANGANSTGQVGDSGQVTERGFMVSTDNGSTKFGLIAAFTADSEL